ncbi:hypothetical protein LCGC14_0606100 [marine sediment metagenome]|uniref:Uncharacterized protein n=1 Tax=marine sediment metagenome TaxID=412755 RepID=A0A0F9UHI1_9ZZZZ
MFQFPGDLASEFEKAIFYLSGLVSSYDLYIDKQNHISIHGVSKSSWAPNILDPSEYNGYQKTAILIIF